MAGPISISIPGADVTKATGTNLSLSTKNPFAKLDSTLQQSFATINLTFAHEPPNPDGMILTYLRTLVYSFPHGYTYIPSTWFMVSLNGFLTAVGNEGVVVVGSASSFGTTQAVLTVDVDATNVYFYIDKFYTATFLTPVCIGLNLSIRSYIFVNDLSGTDIPAQA